LLHLLKLKSVFELLELKLVALTQNGKRLWVDRTKAYCCNSIEKPLWVTRTEARYTYST